MVKEVCQEYPLQLTSKGLFLIDLNVLAANTAHPAGMKPAETHVAKTSQPKFNVPSPEILRVLNTFAMKVNAVMYHQKSIWQDRVIKVFRCPSACSVLAKVHDRSEPDSRVVDHGVVDRASSEAANSSSGGAARPVTVLFGADGWHENRVRHQARGKDLQGSVVVRPTADHWVLKHYQASKKGVHRMVIHYITLKIERAELEGKSIPVVESQPQPIKNLNKAAGKPLVMTLTRKAKSRPVVPSEVEDLSMWDLGEMGAEEFPIESCEVQNLEHRMQNVEGALQSIVMHLDHMAANHPPPLSRAEAAEQ